MKHKLLAALMILFISIGFNGCLNSLIFDQNTAVDKDKEFEKKLNGFQRDFSMDKTKKDYETNRIFSNDFPVTYRAKEKKTF